MLLFIGKLLGRYMKIYIGEDNTIRVNFGYQYSGWYRLEATLPCLGNKIIWRNDIEEASDVNEY